jgi:uncharacterized GH25 family protein
MISNRRGVTRVAGPLVLVVLASFLVLFLSKWTAAANPKPAPVLDRDFEIQVVDSVSKEPISDAEVSIRMTGAQSRKDQTEDKGRVWVLLPEKDPSYLSIAVKKEGYVTNRLEYREGGDAIPPTYTIELVRGISIGGIIQDEQGNPIAAVEMICMFPGGNAATRKRGNFTEIANARSDDQGRWRCDGIPSDSTDISIKVMHPDFVSDKTNDYTTAPPIEQLRAMKGVIVMKKGLNITGVVLDEAGKPIQNASVVNGNEQYMVQVARAFSDAEGRFVLKNLRAETQTLTVTAKQHAPTAKEVRISKDMPPLEFRLGKPNTIRGKVVDVSGKPIGGVRVEVSRSRGEQKWQWSANTKGDGTFVWSEAPAEETAFWVIKEGFIYEYEFKMKPSDKEYVITLRPPRKIHGSVVDGQTGKAIESFVIVPGRKDYANSSILWQRSDDDMKKGRDGQYEIEFVQPAALGWLVSIEAPGYVPAVSPLYKDKADVVFDVKLQKGAGPAGTVRKPDGTPAAGAEVVLATPSSQVQIKNSTFDNRQTFALSTKTAADGRFEFAPQVDPFLVLAISDDGYAEATQEQLKASSDVKLQAWGKVTGKLKRGSKPWPEQTVQIDYDWRYDPKLPRIFAQYETKTDKDGNFTFEHALPKEARVGRLLVLWAGQRMSSHTNSHAEKITVKPGETVNVQVGGKGRPVIGKIVVPNDPEHQVWRLDANLQNAWYRPNMPVGFDEWSEEKQREWWKSNAAERHEQENSRRYYAFPIAEDRSFRIEDVDPGTYQLTISRSIADARDREVLASAQMEVKIEEIPGGQTDEPLDISSVELKPTKQLKPGRDLPVTIIKTIDGPAVNLADYKGKFVLIHFWSSVSKEFAPELAVLKGINEQFARDGRMVILGINNNSIPATGKTFAEQNGMKWVQAYVGMNSMIYSEMRIREYPAHLLIGPDGKLIGNVTKIEELKAEVSKAVGKAAQ